MTDRETLCKKTAIRLQEVLEDVSKDMEFYSKIEFNMTALALLISGYAYSLAAKRDLSSREEIIDDFAKTAKEMLKNFSDREAP